MQERVTALDDAREERKRAERWLAVRSGLGWFCMTAAAVWTLVCAAMLIGGPTDAQEYKTAAEWLSTVLVCFSCFAVPPLALGGWLLHTARQIRRSLAPPAIAAADDSFTSVLPVVREQVRRLPRSHRKQVRVLTAELDRLERHCREVDAKLAELGAPPDARSLNALEGRRRELARSVETEADPVTCDALRQQLRAVEGQLDARRGLEQFRERLEESREASRQTLLHLQSELTLLAAVAGKEHVAEAQAAAEQLHSLNRELASTREAAEEVLRLGR